MVARNYTAVTTLRIIDSVQLPRGSTTELRSATPLGDVFVSVRPPQRGRSRRTRRDGDTIGLDSTASSATVESVLSSAAVLVNGGAVRNFTNIVNGLGKATGDQGQAFGTLIRKTNHTLGTLNARSDQISTALTETSRLVDSIEAKNESVGELMAAARPATETLAAHATQIADLVEQVGDTSEQLRKFPSIAGSDTSGRSVIADANTIAGAWNDVALTPDATLYALNRLMPPWSKPRRATRSRPAQASTDLCSDRYPTLDSAAMPACTDPSGTTGINSSGRCSTHCFACKNGSSVGDRLCRNYRSYPTQQNPVKRLPFRRFQQRRPMRRFREIPPGPTSRSATGSARTAARRGATMIATIADGMINVVKVGHRRRAWLSAAALLFTLVLATAYLLVGALRVDPLATTYQVTIELPESAGLLPNQDVTLRGVPIGRVERLDITRSGVNAVVSLKSTVPIPKSSDVSVSGLSPAGEQYINFVADSNTGPYLSEGSVIGQGRATVPVSLATLLADADGALAQVDTAKLELIRKELSLSDQGPQKLADVIDGGTFLSTLDSVLPETTTLLRTSRVALTLAARQERRHRCGLGQSRPDLRRHHQDARWVSPADQPDPGTLSTADNLFIDNSDTMVQLLGSLTTTSQLLYLRVPALNALFPDYRTSMLDALGSVMHDNGLWTTGDIYPRYACDYGTPRRPPSSADYPEPFMYTYCRDDHPGVLVRGAKNAPRPAGDDTAGPPQGADLGRTTDPTPKGRYTIPTPYGGPTLPIEPPR